MQCDCQQTWCSECLWRVAIPRDAMPIPAGSPLPALPEGWRGPFRLVDSDVIRQTPYHVFSANQIVVASYSSREGAAFLAALLNAVYGGGEGKS